MTCYYPIRAYRSKNLTATGKRALVFKEKDAFYGSQPLEIPCGQCMACKLERSKQWAVRISNEAQLYRDRNCFVTLTYAPAHLPPDGSLDITHHQLFMKRLRKAYPRAKIRFFMCGEYGEQLGRPHYHYCLLNHDFPDKKHVKTNSRGDMLYRSAALSRLWPFGHHEIGSVTFESAAYVARYVTKKITGPSADAHYTRVDAETGELFKLRPEFTAMSRRPGIGAPWLKQFSTDVYPQDALVIRGGVKIAPPRYYNNQYEIMEPSIYATVKQRRIEKNPANQQFTNRDAWLGYHLDNTTERLKVKETVHKATVNSTLKRKLEME